jgi:hypothetical protein
MPKKKDKTTQVGKIIVFGSFLGAAVMKLLALLGLVGFNLGDFESIMWLGIGAFVLAESAGENVKKLKKLDPIVVGEAVAGLLWLVYGVALLANYTNVVMVFNDPIKMVLLGVGIVVASLEAMTKLLD